MYHRSYQHLFLLFVLLRLCLHSFAIDLGIQKDTFLGDDGHPIDIQSYTGHITFNEDTKNDVGQYPPQYMSDEKMLKLAWLAYNEMGAIFERSLLPFKSKPSAMIALAFGKELFFASSMKVDYKAYYAGQTSNQQLKDSLKNCQETSEMVHRSGLACGEPNVLDLSLTAQGLDSLPSSRITALVRVSKRHDEEPKNIAPCATGARGYGCEAIVKAFGLEAFWDKTPDPTDGSEWTNHYTIGHNPRGVCTVP